MLPVDMRSLNGVVSASSAQFSSIQLGMATINLLAWQPLISVLRLKAWQPLVCRHGNLKNQTLGMATISLLAWQPMIL